MMKLFRALSALLVISFAANPWAVMAATNTKTFTVTPQPPPVTSDLSGAFTVTVTFTVTGNSNPNSLRLWTTTSTSQVTLKTATISIDGATANFVVDTSTTPARQVVTFTGYSAIKDPVTLTVTGTTNGGCSNPTINWGALMWTGSTSSPSNDLSLTGGPYSTTIVSPCTATVSCGGTLDSGTNTSAGNTARETPGYVWGARGLFNAYGICGTNGDTTNYYIDNQILQSDKLLSFLWNQNANATAVFSMAGNGPLEDVDSDGWQVDVQPRMSWKSDSGGTKQYINALSCVAPSATQTYGALYAPGGPVIAGTTSITILTGSSYDPLPPNRVSPQVAQQPPYMIRVDGERLKVTAQGAATTCNGSPCVTLTVSATQTSHSNFALITSDYPLLPEPYGKLTSAMAATTTPGTITFSITARERDLPPAPFPILIVGDGTPTAYERLLVTGYTAVNGPGSPTATLTATRLDGAGYTVNSAHAANAYVMSTPLPLIPSAAATPFYAAGTIAQMCVWQFRVKSVGMDPVSGATYKTPRTMRTYFWIDAGDAVMSWD